MSQAARSLMVFAIYLALLSVTLLFAPNRLLEVFALPPTDEVWIRVVGMLAGLIGFYYAVAARAESLIMFRASVLARLAVPIFFLAFVLAGRVGWQLLLFGGVDIVGAAWTWSALRAGNGPAA